MQWMEEGLRLLTLFELLWVILACDHLAPEVACLETLS